MYFYKNNTMNTTKHTFVKYTISIALLLFTATYICAADEDEELMWYEDRTEAFAAAKKENKNILLFWGNNSCSSCTITKLRLNQAALRELVDENFILWFCDTDRSDQANDYVALYHFAISYPLICIIDPNDSIVPLSYSTGSANVEKLRTMLTEYLPTANESILATSPKAYIADNLLALSNTTADETISIYTVYGQLVDSFVKKEYSIIRNTSSLPKGILIVRSSEKWTAKIVNQ